MLLVPSPTDARLLGSNRLTIGFESVVRVTPAGIDELGFPAMTGVSSLGAHLGDLLRSFELVLGLNPRRGR